MKTDARRNFQVISGIPGTGQAPRAGHQAGTIVEAQEKIFDLYRRMVAAGIGCDWYLNMTPSMVEIYVSRPRTTKKTWMSFARMGDAWTFGYGTNKKLVHRDLNTLAGMAAISVATTEKRALPNLLSGRPVDARLHANGLVRR